MKEKPLTKSEEKEEYEKKKDLISEQYNCYRACRICPFPGLKCVAGEKPAK